MPLPADGSGIYTPTPDTPNVGIGRTVAEQSAWIMTERFGTTMRTFRHGPTSSKNIFRAMTGWKQTEEELEAFRGGKGIFFGYNWRKPALQNPLMKKVLGNEGRILGTRWAPSSWKLAMELGADQKFGKNFLYNISAGKPVMESSVSVAKSVAWDVPEGAIPTLDDIASVSYQTIKNDPMGALTGELRDKTMRNLIGLGQGQKATYAGNLMRGVMFDVKTGAVTYGKDASWLSKMATKGAAIADDAAIISGGTNFGRFALGTLGVAGAALKMYNYGYMAYIAGKAAWKAGELYFYKAPMSAYKMVGAQLGRGAFSSGDAQLLTGIPANNRQRAVQAIQGSRMNARTALGNEASLLAGHFG